MAIEQWQIEHLTCHVIDKHQANQINLSIREKSNIQAIQVQWLKFNVVNMSRRLLFFMKNASFSFYDYILCVLIQSQGWLVYLAFSVIELNQNVHVAKKENSERKSFEHSQWWFIRLWDHKS